MFNVVVLSNKEDYIGLLDPDRLELEETNESYGLRTLNLTYTFADRENDKKLFRMGNKIWVQGSNTLTDCLYVINTEVEEDLYDENNFKLHLEEVLVELNYAPPFPQTLLKTALDKPEEESIPQKPIFNVKTINGSWETVVDWNALNYWFGDYFNIGVVQNCISEYASRVNVKGTMNLMTLLRQIETETGNVFVTRYEKDLINNTIHRYLDFLNPLNINSDWQFNLEYDFHNIENTSVCYDKEGNIVNEDQDIDVWRYENTDVPDGAVPDDTEPPGDYYDGDVKADDEYDSEAQKYVPDPLNYIPLTNFNPETTMFRIVNANGQLLNTDGGVYHEGDVALSWNCDGAGVDGTDYPSYIFTLQQKTDAKSNTRILGISVNHKSYAIAGTGENNKSFIRELRDTESISIKTDCERSFSFIPDDSYLEIYDYSADKILFRTCLNLNIGHTHEEVLDYGFNLENIKVKIDETECYNAASPLMKLEDSISNRDRLDDLIKRWLDLEVVKGEILPYSIEKISIEATSYQKALDSIGKISRTNYARRPYVPNDNITEGQSLNSYEFERATGYWRAPYNKQKGSLNLISNKSLLEYDGIFTRKDTRNERTGVETLKHGNVESEFENVFSIYTLLAEFLKEHEEPKIEIELDVGNLSGFDYNKYEIHDKIYFKLPTTNELITARVVKTVKNHNDITKNSISIDNYRNINTVKTIPHETYILSSNVMFKYPNKSKLTMTLVNSLEDTDTVMYPADELIMFHVYEKGKNKIIQSFTKTTDINGHASIELSLDPGNYEISISYLGNELYTESELTVLCNVSGVKEKVPKVKDKTKQKIIKKKTKTDKRYYTKYWSKCGLSPKNKKGKHRKVVAIAKPSSADHNKYKYRLYKTVFKNKCPKCGHEGTLRFDAGPGTKCITSAGAHGRGYKIGGVEYDHEITCIHCDSDFCGVTGQDKSYAHNGRLKTLEKPVKSSEAEFKKLRKGKLVYEVKKIEIKRSKVFDSKTRKTLKAKLSKTVRQTASSIVGDSTGSTAMKKIVDFMDKKIFYSEYQNFLHDPDYCLKHKHANCCDGTRLFFELCDAAGLSEYYKFYYVHVYGHVYGVVETKSTRKRRTVDCASDGHGCWGYVCQGYTRTTKASSTYPKRPF